VKGSKGKSASSRLVEDCANWANPTDKGKRQEANKKVGRRDVFFGLDWEIVRRGVTYLTSFRYTSPLFSGPGGPGFLHRALVFGFVFASR